MRLPSSSKQGTLCRTLWRTPLQSLWTRLLRLRLPLRTRLLLSSVLPLLVLPLPSLLWLPGRPPVGFSPK